MSQARPAFLASALVLTALLAAGPARSQNAADPVPWGPTDPADPRLNQGPKEVATGEQGVVSTQLLSSTLAALRVLEDGGNAADAALTALFVQQVHDYHMVFLFGSLSALYYDAESGKVQALNAVAAGPSAARVEKGDPAKVAIGGTVRGAEALWRRFGSREWSSYLEPAIAAAEEGAIVTSFMYGLNFSLFEFGFLGDLRDSAEARAFYMPDGHLVGVGQRWRMPALAATLRQLGEQGPDYMYTGAWGRKFVAAAQDKGHGVTLEDMGEYRAHWTEPVRFTYRGHELVGSPAPDTGGLEVAYNLNVLESFDLRALGHYSESPETLEILARAMDRVRREIDVAVRDPLDWRIPEQLWLSKEYGRMGAEFVRQTLPRVDLAPPERNQAEAEAPADTPGRQLGSDHIVVADRFGNWISLLHTIHGGAPGVFLDGVRATGSPAPVGTVGPGRRMSLPITAIMILEQGKPWLAMGTPGNPPQPVTEVLINILDYGMEPPAAAEAPRFWAFDDEGKLEIESRISEETRTGLARRGIEIRDLGDYNYHTGSMQIVWRGKDGKLHGSTDPRRLGSARGY